MTDDFDRYLRDRLRSIAPGDDDTADALVALAPRARRARTRRRVGTAVAGAGIAAVAIAFVVSLGGSSAPFVQTEIPPATQGTAPDRPPTTSARDRTSTTDDRTSHTSTPSSTTSTATSTPPATGGATTPTLTPTTAGTIPTTPPSGGSTSSSSSTPSSSDAAPTTFPPVYGASTSGVGGTVTFDFDGTNLTLVSAVANAGFTREITHNEPQRIEVRFQSADHETRIEVRVGSSGLEQPPASESGA